MNFDDWLLSFFSDNLKQDDPVFGPLRGKRVGYRGERHVCWHADRQFTGNGEIADVRVFSDEAGPSQAQRKLYTELQERYLELRGLITEPLAREYESLRSGWQLNPTSLQQPSDIWTRAQLCGIEINDQRHRNSDLVIHHSIDGAEFNLNVCITNWRVDEVMLED